jgi:hypothetical protein
MSDYNNPNNFDKYGNPIPGPLGTDPARPYTYDPDARGAGRAPYVLVGLLALIAIIGGAMYFTPHHSATAPDVAQAPAATTDTRPLPPTPPAARPMNTTPAPTATPAPAGAPASTTDTK